jgi:Na+-transporting methylmalonyl-CoA/oxaloacetate decarboxylase gamma subunit
MVDDGTVMTVFLVLLFPLLLMAFALLMAGVENRLHSSSVSEDEVGEFFEQARPEEVNTLIREGWTGALDRFRLRRRPRDRKLPKP